MHYARPVMRVRGFVASASAFALATSLFSTEVHAQNADSFFFGDEAALSAGAVVASGRDSGAFWYNPSGFGELKRGMVSASASTFGVRIRKVPNALRMQIGGQTTSANLASSDIISVPNAVVAATALNDRLALAGGLLVTERDLRSALVSIPEADYHNAAGESLRLSERLDMQKERAKYHFGAAFAAALSSNVRVGIAAYGTYTKGVNSVQYALFAADPGGGRVITTYNQRVTGTAIGAAASVGIQWDISSLMSFGLTIRSPEMALTGSLEGGAVSTNTSVGGTKPAKAEHEEKEPPGLDAAGKFVAPARALAGIAVPLGAPQSWLELGVDATHGLAASQLEDEQKPTVNLRIGARYTLSPSWVVGGGLFTDFARLRRLGKTVALDKVDYYGFTVGFSKRTPLALVRDPSPEALVLVTTLSLRAALGFGEARPLSINFDEDGVQRDAVSRVAYIDVMPYLGSSVIF
ncbi:MAG TPA: hypothetical protein VM925_08980 [Labilithrix sp.]|nr:hypothetical protein [Labilithrix sp.]